MAAPVLAGGVSPESLNSWAYWSSQASRNIAAKNSTLPTTPSGATIVANPVLTGMSTLEGPGLAYSATRANSVTYAMNQQQINIVAAKPNPFQY